MGKWEGERDERRERDTRREGKKGRERKKEVKKERGGGQKYCLPPTTDVRIQ